MVSCAQFLFAQKPAVIYCEGVSMKFFLSKPAVNNCQHDYRGVIKYCDNCASAKVALTRTCNMMEKLGRCVHVRVHTCMSGCEVIELSDR